NPSTQIKLMTIDGIIVLALDCSPEEKIPSNAKDHQPPSEPLFTHHTPAGIGPKKKSPAQ
ncbi:hypothetical protein KUCAC02_006379, partial [Chaenocephalus aceratus]